MIDKPFLGQLRLCVFANVLGRDLDGAPEIRIERTAHVQTDALALETIELAGVIEQRCVAALAHVGEDRHDDALGLFQAYGFALNQRLRVSSCKNPDHIEMAVARFTRTATRVST